jgi:hypothetical protein
MSEQLGDHNGTSGQDMLAVIQHHQDRTAGAVIRQGVQRGLAWHLRDAERSEHPVSDLRILPCRRQVHHAHTAVVALAGRPADLQRQSGLAHTGRSGQRDEAPGRQQRRHLAEFAGTTDEAVQRNGQAAARCRGRLFQQRGAAGRELAPGGCAELRQQRRHVALHGSDGHDQAVGDLAVTQAQHDAAQDLQLARCDSSPNRLQRRLLPHPGHTRRC